MVYSELIARIDDNINDQYQSHNKQNYTIVLSVYTNKLELGANLIGGKGMKHKFIFSNHKYNFRHLSGQLADEIYPMRPKTQRQRKQGT